jgi:hypothetical protein
MADVSWHLLAVNVSVYAPDGVPTIVTGIGGVLVGRNCRHTPQLRIIHLQQVPLCVFFLADKGGDCGRDWWGGA